MTRPHEERKKAIEALCRLGEMFRRGEDAPRWRIALQKAGADNPWFTPENIRFAARQWGELLREPALTQWVDRYPLPDASKNVLLVLAGNIPMVGLHDILCTYVSGHRAVIKPSRDDTALITAATQCLQEAEPSLADRLTLAPGLVREGIDAVIATGNDDTQRYFRYYFRQIPALLRHARYSVGLIAENTSEKELEQLADDMLLYFGLGCRNVTQVLVPEDFDLSRLGRALGKYAGIADHPKYRNNYDYRRAMSVLSEQNAGVYDTGFLLLVPSDTPAAPLGTAGYRRYGTLAQAEDYLRSLGEALQCVVGPGHLPFGSAQRPALDQYADGEDTMEFLRFSRC